MNIGSVGNFNGAYSAQFSQRIPEATEATKGTRDNDGDSDDGGVKAIPSPTVNAEGQQVGKRINVTA
jgi:hypothetical protein